MNYLSNIELYYSPPGNFNKNIVKISDEESYHITKVMRHSKGDIIYVTDGLGKIHQVKILNIYSDFIEGEINNSFIYINEYKNITFCIPKLKNPERFEFALEKSVELGITNFVIFESKRTIAKGSKKERWEKIFLSAMKQSLRSYLARLLIMDVKGINELEGEKIIFEQNSEKKISDFTFHIDKKYYFIFGPEGGLDEDEFKLFQDAEIISLAENRLRTETAVVKCASILTEII